MKHHKARVFVKDVLPLDKFIEYRKHYYSYSKIARLVGLSVSAVNSSNSRLPPELRGDLRRHRSANSNGYGKKVNGAHSYRAKVFALLDEQPELSYKEIAAQSGCSVATASNYRYAWLNRTDWSSKPRCSLCTIIDSDKNPVVAGQCLWCWFKQGRVDGRWFYEEYGGWLLTEGAVQLRDGGAEAVEKLVQMLATI